MGRHRTVYKRLAGNKVAVLGIPTRAKTNEKRKGVVNKTYARYKTNRALVRRIYDVRTKEDYKEGVGLLDSTYTFNVGSYVNSSEFNPTPSSWWDEKTRGFDYFKCKALADSYGNPVVMDTPPKYCVTSYDPLSGRASSVNKVYNGKYDGVQITYDDKGRKSSEEYYANGIRHGPKKMWTNGELVINDIYDQGKLVFIGFIDKCFEKE